MPGNRKSIRADYQRLGYGSVRPHPEGQGEMFPETDTRPSFKELSGYEDLTAKQRKSGERALKTTVQRMTNQFGAHLDAAFGKAAQNHDPENTGPIHAEGQDWYSGGSNSERGVLGHLSRHHGVPFHTVVGIKADVAQNITPFQETRVTHQILEQHNKGVPPKDMRGSTYTGVIRRAAERHLGGADPQESMSDSSFKKAGYAQSYLYPHEDQTRTTVDRWMFRAGAPHLSDDEISGIQRSSAGATKSQGAVAPAHRLVHEAIRRAAESRGLSPAEAQTVIWHHVKGQSEDKWARHMLQKNQMNLLGAQNSGAAPRRNLGVGGSSVKK